MDHVAGIDGYPILQAGQQNLVHGDRQPGAAQVEQSDPACGASLVDQQLPAALVGAERDQHMLEIIAAGQAAINVFQFFRT